MTSTPSTTLKNGCLLTLDPRQPVLHGDLRIRAGRIEAIAPSLPGDSGDSLDVTGKLVIPGFVQTHVHLCQTLFRGQANDLQLLDWLDKVIKPFEAAHDADSTYLSARIGAAELLLSGTTTVSDFGSVHHTASILQAIDDSGIRAQTGKTLMGGPGKTGSPLYQDLDAMLAETSLLLDRWSESRSGLVSMAVIPRGLIGTSPDVYAQAAALAASRHVPLHTHCAENPGEVALITSLYGRHPLDLLDQLGALAVKAQLAHCVHVSVAQISRLAAAGVHVLHCPGSNLKLASGVAPVPAMLSHGVSLSLGSDGAACNDNLDMFTEMRLAALVHKNPQNPLGVKAVDVFRMATLGGASALGLESSIGSLEVGKRADVVVIDLNHPHYWPLWDTDTPAEEEIISRLVYSGKAQDVSTVFVDGRMLVNSGRLLDDSFPLQRQSLEAFNRLQARARASW